MKVGDNISTIHKRFSLRVGAQSRKQATSLGLTNLLLEIPEGDGPPTQRGGDTRNEPKDFDRGGGVRKREFSERCWEWGRRNCKLTECFSTTKAAPHRYKIPRYTRPSAAVGNNSSKNGNRLKTPPFLGGWYPSAVGTGCCPSAAGTGFCPSTVVAGKNTFVSKPLDPKSVAEGVIMEDDG